MSSVRIEAFVSIPPCSGGVALKRLLKEIEAEFKDLPDWEELRSLLLSTRYFRRRELEDMMGYDQDTAKHVVRFLSSHQLIESTTGGYRKREFFIQMLKEMKAGGGRKEKF